MRRLSKRERLQEQVKSLDVFSKVEPDTGITQSSTSGALVTLVTAAIVCVLVWSEISEYNTLKIKYDYFVDTDLRRDMNMTVDMTVAMQCDHIGADYINLSGESTDGSKYLKLEPAHFELSPNQLEWLEAWAKVKSEEGSRGLDSLSRFLHGSMREPMPTAAPEIDSEPDACRLHGVLPVAKVAANFHITAGKSVHHSRGHSHVNSMVPPDAVNFSHRIDRFSFSEEPRGAMALDGDLRTTDQPRQVFQYFLEVVPSTTQRLGQRQPFRSNQYSVTEQHRVLKEGARGIPGIYFKFDIESIGVSVSEEHPPLSRLLIRLCGIVGGIVAASGMLHSFIGWIIRTVSGNKTPAVAPAAAS
ncbi:hypothetical protein PTSG_04435 [Salpingoeca rosetta]|uniref:Endoplasmic reticulum-Golgi intermediate compartment protein 2 n=1 Tax=Salpingoeca rosetta (strain ATCC 50818 / BSB-021) TaxID=946362 RepID=F2U8J9_SALR5|nr:uncharacterized protein PTSG_04435 [Salpingoeca rosetta]EGD72707.1 hypothetical protein PTSG_04435 [Salpingoeca rosetta]|eukprot:XP_004994530.1 hypothetical protein PTSG_04435 [Salpingoeca rosetta]